MDSTLLTGAAAPISLGPSVGGERKDGEKGGFEGGDDFVFAYGLRRVSLKEKKGGEREVVQEEWTKGAMYGVDGDERGEEESNFEVVGVDEEGVGAADLKCEVMEVMEEGEEEDVFVVRSV